MHVFDRWTDGENYSHRKTASAFHAARWKCSIQGECTVNYDVPRVFSKSNRLDIAAFFVELLNISRQNLEEAFGHGYDSQLFVDLYRDLKSYYKVCFDVLEFCFFYFEIINFRNRVYCKYRCFVIKVYVIDSRTSKLYQEHDDVSYSHYLLTRFLNCLGSGEFYIYMIRL